MFKLSYFTNRRNFWRETFPNTRFWEISKYSMDKLSQNTDKEEYCEKNFHESSKFVVKDINFL